MPFLFATPVSIKSSGIFTFGNPPKEQSPEKKRSNLLLGVTAAALTGAFLATQRKKSHLPLVAR